MYVVFRQYLFCWRFIDDVASHPRERSKRSKRQCVRFGPLQVKTGKPQKCLHYYEPTPNQEPVVGLEYHHGTSRPIYQEYKYQWFCLRDIHKMYFKTSKVLKKKKIHICRSWLTILNFLWHLPPHIDPYCQFRPPSSPQSCRRRLWTAPFQNSLSWHLLIKY